MINDEQIEIASIAMMKANRFMPGYVADENDPLGVKKSIREGLEAYEKSKWIKFDSGEPITWPNKAGSYWTNNGMRTWVDYRNIGCDAFFTDGAQPMETLNYLVDYYQELPDISEYSLG